MEQKLLGRTTLFARDLNEKNSETFSLHQLRKGFVQIRADRYVAFVAVIMVCEFTDHARLFVQFVSFELHGAGLQSSIAGHYQPAKAGFACRDAAGVQSIGWWPPASIRC